MKKACAGCGCAKSVCQRVARREFLQGMGALAAAILAGLGASPAEARAAGVTAAAGKGSGDERRYPLPAGDGVTVDHDNDVIVARLQDRIYAFSLACPHQNTALRWLAAEDRFQCPRHESKYRPDGEFIAGRATRNMDRFAVRKEGNEIVVQLDRLFQSDRQASQWQAAFATA